jgi:hypothetical protein
MAKNITPQTIQQLIEQITVPEPGDPRNASDVENPAQALLNNAKYLLEQLAAHIEAQAVHGATSAATANAIVRRDGSGRAKVAAPSAPDDIARKAELDTHQHEGVVFSNELSYSVAPDATQVLPKGIWVFLGVVSTFDYEWWVEMQRPNGAWIPVTYWVGDAGTVTIVSDGVRTRIRNKKTSSKTAVFFKYQVH